MRRHALSMLCVALACALGCVFASLCVAEPIYPKDFEDGRGINELSDRYEFLNNLGNSLTEQESVVIETRIGVLTSVNRALDDSDVRFSGEIVGDVVDAGPGYRWANASGSSDTVISIYMPEEHAALIQNTGSYHMRGTTLKMTGEYHVACPQHQGELDVHTTNVEVVDNGGPIMHRIGKKRSAAALTFCCLSVLIIAAFFSVRFFLKRRGKQ